jgi:hypothetical protein
VMRSICVTTAALLVTTSSAAETRCAIPGELIHWQADFCLYKNGTDDFHQASVQECLGQEVKKRQKDACAAKTYYKKAICTTVGRYPPYNGSPKVCFEDSSFSGPTVRNGGV